MGTGWGAPRGRTDGASVTAGVGVLDDDEVTQVGAVGEEGEGVLSQVTWGDGQPLQLREETHVEEGTIDLCTVENLHTHTHIVPCTDYETSMK
jgi:hypothetical protein